MPKSVDNYVERTSYKLMHLLLRCGGYAPLHRVQFSKTVIQYSLDQKLVQVKNTGHGFLLSIVERN
ncbi:hypothetical protein GS682_30905 [Nostoc sp. B(2019)]|nr:hypothetical protein [Nostoc sp. B(2019)]